LVRVAGLARQELERRRVVRRDVVAEVEAGRAAGDGEALVGGVVEAAWTSVSDVGERGKEETYCVLAFWRQYEIVSIAPLAPPFVVVRHLAYV
jgi:hypothetical protein